MTVEIYVKVELYPSPQLVELLQNIEIHATASPGLLDAIQQPARPESELEKVMKYEYILKEIAPFSAPKPVQLKKQSNHLEYAEENEKLMLRYLSGTIYTTWPEIMHAYHLRKDAGVRIFPAGKAGNKHTCLNQFLKAVSDGLRQGQAVGSQDDPDADFRPHLRSVIDTSTRYDGGKIEGSL
ncbi:MAG: hypothetical protein M8353_03310 [ANME-2 cluster archaeon]|nr:hypothetical protein [ANME-2 cluster archaeon]